MGVGGEDLIEPVSSPGEKPGTRRGHPHAFFDPGDTGSKRLYLTGDLHEAKTTSLIAPFSGLRRATLPSGSRTLIDRLPGFEFTRIDGREIGVRAQSRDVYPGTIGGLENRRAGANLDQDPIHGERGHGRLTRND
jgi:hypothetical protein